MKPDFMNNKISAVIITYNEERNIGRCLESLSGIADEIVVVDSFSTDKTREICSRYQIKFILHKFEGYVEQKNWAITQAQYEHVLSLDADEVLSDALKESIIKIKENELAIGYTMNRLTCYCGNWIRHCGWYPDVKLRIFDRRKGSWIGSNPHDHYEITGGSEGIIRLKGDILHYSYYSLSQHLQQVDKFTSIASESAFRKGKTVTVAGITVRTWWTFFRGYFLNLGILDGYAGFLVCRISAFATFMKYTKLKELCNHQKDEVTNKK
jgi:glycosyltransferase involved in cell wall biosynthesis